MRIWTILLVGLIGFALMGSTCDETHVDSRQPDRRNVDTTAPDHVIAMPDEFPNVATKCAGFDHYRVWVVSHTKDDVTPQITTDEKCP